MAFRSRGVRALVMMQMSEMRSLFAVWKKAKRIGVRLPVTEDPAYQTIDTLMRHPLRSCRGYLTWLCEVTGRPEPKIPDPPDAEKVLRSGAAYLDVLERAWHRHMAWMPGRTLDSFTVHTSRWGQPMTIEAMFEHAVAHPMRHRFQLEELIEKAGRKARKVKRAPRRRA
jgi:uncharacterized damage-inducible protein DinB